MVKLIGLYSERPQCGKSTVAAALNARGYSTVPFAGTLKRMIRLLLLDLGLDDLEVEHAMAGGKELPCSQLGGTTPRQAMQWLGTDWGRQMVDTNLWVRCWQERTRHCLEHGGAVVVDDVRFPQEAQLIEQLGGVMVEVLRPGGGSEAFAAHASEGALDSWPFKAQLLNDGDLADLERSIDLLLEKLNAN